MSAYSCAQATIVQIKGNRRRAGRHRVDVLAALDDQTQLGDPMPVRLVQWSIGGAGLISSKPLEVGALYRLTAFDSLVPPAGVVLRVITVRGRPDGSFSVGAAVVAG